MEEQNVTIPSKENATVPDEAMSIKEIMDRVQKGLPVYASNKSPQDFHTDDFDSVDMEELNRLDPVDAQDIIQDVVHKGRTAHDTFHDNEKRAKAERQQRSLDKRKALLEEIDKKISDSKA